MTIIVWDGKTLAADKQASSHNTMRKITKIRRIHGQLVGISGDADRGMSMFAWLENGADIEKYPKFQDSENYVDMVVISSDGTIKKYEKTPHSIIFEDANFAMGSGRDFALAAMHLGCDAYRAVEVAIKFDTGCGNGIDCLTLEVEI